VLRQKAFRKIAMRINPSAYTKSRRFDFIVRTRDLKPAFDRNLFRMICFWNGGVAELLEEKNAVSVYPYRCDAFYLFH
jgi:hypothetical protein